MNIPQPGTWHHAQETYDLLSGIKCCKEKIHELLRTQPGTIIVQIAGGSASGKTSQVTKSIAEDAYLKKDISLLSMDDYYRGITWMQQQQEHGKEYNFDQPEVINIPRLQEHLSMLKQGESIQKPIYCMKSSEPIGTETIHPARLIIMEGLFALSDELHKTGDLNVFVSASTATRLIRRIYRDTSRTNQDVESIVGYFEHYVEPMHQKYVEPSRENAHIVLETYLGHDELTEVPRNQAIAQYLERDFCRKLRENTSQ